MPNQEQLLARRKPFNERFGCFTWPYDAVKVNMDLTRTQLSNARDIGFRIISLGPNPTSPDEDIEDFTPAMNLALSMGFTVRVALSGSAVGHDAQDYPKHIHDYDPYFRKFIRRWSGRGIIWDGTNEPNNPGFWYHKSSFYDRSVIKDWISVDRNLQRIVQEEDPTSLFLTGNLYRSPYDLQKGQWADEWDDMVADGLMSSGDAVSVHPYLEDANTGVAKPPEAMLKYMATPDNATLPIVITEFGVQHHVRSEQAQADWLARTYFILDMMGIPFALQYGFYDAENGDGNGWYGLYRKDWTINQAGVAIKDWLSELNGFYFKQRVSTGDDANDYVLEYSLGLTHKLIGWTTRVDHDVTVNGSTYTLSESPKVLNTFQQQLDLQKVDVVWNLKEVLNNDTLIIQQVAKENLTRLKRIFPDTDDNADIQLISANRLDREFRLQMIELFTQMVNLLERVSDGLHRIGYRFTLEQITVPRSLMINVDAYNRTIDTMAANISTITKYELK